MEIKQCRKCYLISDLQYHLHSEMHYSDLWKGNLLTLCWIKLYFFIAKLDKCQGKTAYYYFAVEQAKLQILPVWISDLTHISAEPSPSSVFFWKEYQCHQRGVIFPFFFFLYLFSRCSSVSLNFIYFGKSAFSLPLKVLIHLVTLPKKKWN